MPRLFVLPLLIAGLAPGLFAQESSLESVLNEIALRLSARDFNSAIALFDRLSREDQEKTEIRIMRASVLNSAGRVADAKRIADAIIAAEPENTEALMVLADVAAIEKKDRDRRAILERVIKANPNHARALNDLGNINIGNRNLRSAAGYFDRVLSFDPINADALVGRATIHRYEREQRSAEILLNRAIIAHPNWAGPLQERARLYKGAGLLNDALADLDIAKRLEPNNYWVIVDRGLVLMDMNRRQEALAEFSRAIEIDPNHFIAYVYSAGLKDEAGDYEGAIRDYTKLASLKPEYYFAFEGLGILKMREKKWAEARDAFLEAYKQAPGEYTYALLAAINWARAGRMTDPVRFLAQVLRTVPRDTLEYSMLRLFHDLNGDVDVAIKVENEKNNYKKARMLFYLASYYDMRGNTTLANRYYTLVQELDAVASIEWRLNEWILAERGLGLRAAR